MSVGLVQPSENGTNEIASTAPVETEPPTIVNNNQPVIMDYSVDFPKLPEAVPSQSKPTAAGWGPVKSSTVTEAVTFQANARASKMGKRLGEMSEEQQKCKMIAQATGAKIELSEARDQSLTVLISGKRSQVDEARIRLLRELQTQCEREIRVAKEFRGALIGKEGANLRRMEQEFSCKITMPGRSDSSDNIKVHGPPEFVNVAIQRIESIVKELAKQATETISVPRSFYPWIRGPANENVDRLQSENSVKINIPPPSSEKETIVITGEREGVFKVAAILKDIYSKKKSAASITCNVPRAQHRYVLGVRRSGVDDILRETDVIVDVPPESEKSDVITLRGETQQLANALSLVYAKATSVISKELKYDEWQRRFLIGPKGATLQSLVPNQDKLKIDFEDGGMIYLEGSPEQVSAAEKALQNEVNRLTTEMASETVNVPAALHRHIVGRNGSLVTKLKNDNDVQITIPDGSKGSDEIRVEGKKEGVKNAIASIKEIVTRLENEKSKTVNIEQRFHGQLIGKHGENINKWRQEFPSVSIAFPDAASKSDNVTLRGDKKEVDKLAALMAKMGKDLVESSFQATLPIVKEYYKHIIGKSGSNINKIREETNTRIELPAHDSTDGELTVIGKEADVAKAIEMLKKIQAELAEAEERKLRSFVITVDVPVKYHQRIIGPGGHAIREMQQRHNAQIKIPRSDDQSETITIIGYEDKAQQCKEEIQELIKNLEAMVSVEVEIDSRFHPRMIGQRGRNLRKMQSEYKVEIRMPGRSDSNQNLVVISGKDEKAIEECIEKLRQQEEDFLDDMNERGQYLSTRHEPVPEKPAPRQVKIQGAPWQMDEEQFPSMAGSAAPSSAATGIWGNRKW